MTNRLRYLQPAPEEGQAERSGTPHWHDDAEDRGGFMIYLDSLIPDKEGAAIAAFSRSRMIPSDTPASRRRGARP